MPKYNNNMKITVVDKKYCDKGEYFQYNKAALGEAIGQLNLAGVRAYLYLAHNTQGEPWTYNSTAYAGWLGMTRHSADSSFKDSALDNLKEESAECRVIPSHPAYAVELYVQGSP